jgi:hypothetical protein
VALRRISTASASCSSTVASVGDALAVSQWLARYHVLAAGDEIALDHHTHDAVLAARDLAGDIGRDQRLVFRLLARIGVARIHHHQRPTPYFASSLQAAATLAAS